MEFNQLLKTSPYVETLIDPKNNKAYYPDFDQTTSHLKMITLNTVIRPPVDDILLIHRPLHPDNTKILQLFARDPILGGYTFVTDIQPDEDLSLNYDRARIVSGLLNVVSNTVAPSVNFTISGNMNACDVQTLPNLRTLTYQTIPSFRRNQRDVVLNSQLMKGVTSLHHPESQNRFRLLESNSSENTDNFLRIGLDYTNYNEAVLDGFVFGAIPPAYSKVLSVSQGNLPSGIEGYVTCEISFQFAGALVGQMFMNVVTRSLDPVDYVTPIENVTTVVTPTGTTACMHIRTKLYFSSPIERIEIRAPALNPTDFVAFNLSIESENYYQIGYRNPATLIGMIGFVPNAPGGLPGQSISLGGVYNYEAVPDSELARQIQTDAARSEENPLVLMQVLNLVSKGFIKFCWSTPEYVTWLAAMGRTIPRMDTLGRASGFGDFLSNLIGAVTPIVSAATSEIMPGSGMLVRELGNGLRRVARNASGVVPFNASGVVPFNFPKQGFAAGCQTNEESKENRGQAGLLDNDNWKAMIADINIVNKDIEPPEVIEGDIEFRNNSLLMEPEYKSLYVSTLTAGMYHNVAFSWGANRFPYVRGTKAFLGLVVISDAPFDSAKYESVTYQFRGVTGSIKLATSADLDPSSIGAIAFAHIYSSKPNLWITIRLDPRDTENTLGGGSLGMATFLGLIRKFSPFVITGAIGPEGEFFQPGMVKEKMVAVKAAKSALIVANDTEDYPDLDTETQVTNSIEIAAGDLGNYDTVSSVFLVNSLPVATLAVIYSNNSLVNKGIDKPLLDMTLEEFVTDEGKTAYKPVKDIAVNKKIKEFYKDNMHLLVAMQQAGKFPKDPRKLGKEQQITMWDGAKSLIASYKSKLEEALDAIHDIYPEINDEDELVDYIDDNWKAIRNARSTSTNFRDASKDLILALPGYYAGTVKSFITTSLAKRKVKAKRSPRINNYVQRANARRPSKPVESDDDEGGEDEYSEEEEEEVPRPRRRGPPSRTPTRKPLVRTPTATKPQGRPTQPTRRPARSQPEPEEEEESYYSEEEFYDEPEEEEVKPRGILRRTTPGNKPPAKPAPKGRTTTPRRPAPRTPRGPPQPVRRQSSRGTFRHSKVEMDSDDDFGDLFEEEKPKRGALRSTTPQRRGGKRT